MTKLIEFYLYNPLKICWLTTDSSATLLDCSSESLHKANLYGSKRPETTVRASTIAMIRLKYPAGKEGPFPQEITSFTTWP
jgi:hypothetical protein